ncbi:MAG: ATPase domain-containing protein [Planctomycetia bacterium]|nr:ATPase domain-containing protein [Planctomycetia bacterium]
MTKERLSTGVPGLDELIGGGLVSGTMTVLVGSSGIGKTQFGLQFLQAGLTQEGHRGIILDMTVRGDSQNHNGYAENLFQWKIEPEDSERRFDPKAFFNENRKSGDYFRALTKRGKRVNRRDLDFDEWFDWQSDLSRHLDAAIAFFFGHFVQGTRRCLIDGIEPIDHQGESIQFELLEYIYHQIIQKEPDWVARDLFRQNYRNFETEIAKRLYRREDIGCLVSYTSPETSLDSMISKPLDEGDLLAGANTIIYLGKIRDGNKFRKALYVSKHRGSVCPDEIILYNIDDHGIRVIDS